MTMRSWLRSNRGFLLFLACFALFRTAVADWNPVPSGSMRPTLLEGDVVFVNRLAYDLKVPLTDVGIAAIGEPKRGDIVTFFSPRGGTRLVKRIVGLPGDTIAMRKKVLYVNGIAARYSDPALVREPPVEAGATALRVTETIGGSRRRIQYLPDASPMESFGPLVVPADSYFMLGDNRDNSADSRYIGPVARRLLIGRVNRLVASADIVGDWMPRIERFGKPLD
jgi:signal peptidase I